jgi:hypothetical protein
MRRNATHAIALYVFPIRNQQIKISLHRTVHSMIVLVCAKLYLSDNDIMQNNFFR